MEIPPRALNFMALECKLILQGRRVKRSTTRHDEDDNSEEEELGKPFLYNKIHD